MSLEKKSALEMDWKPEEIRESIVIRDPEISRLLLQKDKNRILTLLIKNKEMTIQQLSNALLDGKPWNPGTIKRHLDDLIRKKFVFKSGQKRSVYNVKMKFYSAAAKEFVIDIHIPDKKVEN